jgi:hypothetical protein
MHKSATKCNETIGKWCKNKHGASKIIDTFETYYGSKFLKPKVFASGGLILGIKPFRPLAGIVFGRLEIEIRNICAPGS